jgi:iron complex transport system permease protein
MQTTGNRAQWRLAGLVLLLPVAAFASLALGAEHLTPAQLVHALLEPDGAEGDVIVRHLRFPRTVLGLLVGAALGAAGVLMQGHTRNALAEPGLLGVSAGAALAVVLSLRFGYAAGLLGMVGAAAVGSCLASLAVYALARRSIREGGPALVVAGAALTAFLGAFTSAVVLLDAKTLDSYRFWAVGSLSERGQQTPWIILPFVLAGLVLAIVNARSLDLLALGDEMASALGLRIRRARLVGLLAVTLLTAAAVAACGPVAFIGLLAGTLARALVGPSWSRGVPAGALAGAVLTVGSDVVGRLVAGPGELQVGVVSGVLGAPLLIWVIRRRGLIL